MRVANKSLYDSVKFELGSITEALSKANQVVSTAKRINNLSDDPVGLNQILNIKSFVSNIDQLGRNIDMGKTWITVGESALNNVQDLLTEAKALCVQMANDTVSGSERRAAAETAQNMLEELISLANTEVNGRYVFAGSDTDNMPFDSSGNYSGDNNPFTLKIGKNATIQVGSDGEAVFKASGNDLFQTFSDLVAALQGNDLGGIQTAMGNLDSNAQHVATKISDLGSKMRRLEMKESIFQDSKLANTQRLSKLEDADIADAIMDLQAKQTAYQAALASSSKILKMSLVDFL